jgi:hypothetical protein
LLQAIVVVACLMLFVWMMLTGPKLDAGRGKEDSAMERDRSKLIGVLTGMTGGSIEDAAVARYALQRFEDHYGRKATDEDLAILIGMMREMR